MRNLAKGGIFDDPFEREMSIIGPPLEFDEFIKTITGPIIECGESALI